ncbi:hypothetical protein B0J11DRAFT_272750 [Dendryphion nanum]|uniref:Uncharacterized protein n=1 Tax=Dendryphion nanum TaxID=256645 RepID=A0A9P9DY11_9PLEO|nr:hypothetical protein B0J11DRAFT_272750 [Dendryphion nanum]
MRRGCRGGHLQTACSYMRQHAAAGLPIRADVAIRASEFRSIEEPNRSWKAKGCRGRGLFCLRDSRECWGVCNHWGRRVQSGSGESSHVHRPYSPQRVGRPPAPPTLRCKSHGPALDVQQRRRAKKENRGPQDGEGGGVKWKRCPAASAARRFRNWAVFCVHRRLTAAAALAFYFSLGKSRDTVAGTMMTESKRTERNDGKQ